MSEKNNSRTRRRASRSAGPPVDEVRNEALSASDPDRSDAVEPGTAVPGSAHVRGQETDKTDTSLIAGAGGADTDTVKLSTGTAKVDADTVRFSAGTVQTDADTVTSSAGTVKAASAQSDADTVKLGKTSSGKADDSSSADSGLFQKTAKPQDDVPSADAADGNRPRRAVRILAVAASTIVALALVAGAVISVFAVRSADERDALRAEYIQTARQTVLNLTTIRADTAKEDIDRILTMASGEFKDEFNRRVDPFTEVVKQAKVQSTGEVVEAALESSDDNSARVLVAAKQTVTNAGQEGPQLRYYRFRITVTNSDSGMTASDVEFVA
ncbi:hypothetical protein [Nocardia cyriacigeorgica]|uniref:hypothetical protein n=1 Tax=Nocardia cyriacigeorgica TaxID=135487 RepID=UPI0018957F50|nr:hypothetical protein [Nocardia cyriacigeorgica]MBF6413614.1 hypothetical protein [Nocardia cyriacigeorgica]